MLTYKKLSFKKDKKRFLEKLKSFVRFYYFHDFFFNWSRLLANKISFFKNAVSLLPMEVIVLVCFYGSSQH